MYNADDIVAILKSRSKLIDWDSMKDDVFKLVALAIVRSIKVDDWCKNTDVVLPVNNGIAELPDDLMRLIRVRDLDNCPIKYGFIRASNFVKPKNIITGHICIDYYSLVTNEDGGIPIHKDQLDYAVAHVERIKFRDMLLEGKINMGVYDRLQADEQAAFNVANKTRITADQMECALWMMRQGRYYLDSRIAV